jgi:hypothetical protein
VQTTYLRRIAPPVFLGALVVLFFPALASLAHLPAAKDTLTFSYPAQLELGRGLREGYFPLWSTHLNSPLFAEGQGGFAHPLALMLFAFLPAAAASNLFLLLHVYAGLVFTYLLCRELGQSRLAAVLAAPAFALSAYFLVRLGIYTIITNGVWLPGLLWLAARFARTGDFRYALAGGLGGALALLAGQFQLACYAVVAAAVYAAVYARPRKNALAAAAAFGVFPLLLAAVQLIPTYELWRLSERASDLRAGEYSFWPPQFAQLLLPELFGRAPHPAFAPIGEAQIDSYWGRSSFVESAFYVGALPLALAAVGNVKKRRWFFVAAGLLATAFACGAYTPLFKIYKFLPPFGLFRAPGRLLIYTTLALAVAAGDGLDYFVRTRSRAPALAALGAAAAAAAVALTFRFTLPQFKAAAEARAAAKAEEVGLAFGNADTVKEYYAAKAKTVFRKAASAARLRNPATWFQLAVLGAGVVLFWGARRNRAVAAAAPYVVILLTVGDLYRYHEGLNPTVNASLVNEAPPVAAAFDPARPGRVYSNGFSLGPDTQLGLGLIHENAHALWGFDLLVPRGSLRPAAAVAVFEKIENSYTTAPYAGGERFVKATASGLALMRAYGIRYVVRLNPWFGEGVKAAGYVPPYYVYEVVGAAARARSLSAYRLAGDDESALRMMAADGFEPGREVVLYEKAEGFAAAAPAAGAVDVERRTSLEASCRVSGPSLLVLDEMYYPGWRATVDGEPTRTYRANVISRAVVVPPGPHMVTFRFRPTTFYVGLAVSLASWLVTLALVARLTLRRRKRGPGDP